MSKKLIAQIFVVLAVVAGVLFGFHVKSAQAFTRWQNECNGKNYVVEQETGSLYSCYGTDVNGHIFQGLPPESTYNYNWL